MSAKSILTGLFIWAAGLQLAAQNWTTHCGSNERNGMSAQPGPHSVGTPVWTITDAAPTGLGMNIYSFGDRFVTSRVDFAPYSAIIECRNLQTGALVWKAIGVTSTQPRGEDILAAFVRDGAVPVAHPDRAFLGDGRAIPVASETRACRRPRK